jgi:tyrosyl-tRNA synthetase
MKEFERAFGILMNGTVQVVPEEQLFEKLKKDEKLTVKLGADPTAPDLHLGHAVVLTKLKEFQDLGHEVIFLIGDFTACIGDPTGKSKTRPPLTEEEIAHNTATYFEQVSRILNPDKIAIRFNSSWLDKLSSKDIVELCAKITLARLTEREDFANRIKKKEPISFNELLYPLFQAYDSVALQSDVELGGTDQTVNLLMARYIQEQYNQEPQIIMTVPILEGLDGVHKMSKSLGNYIGLAEPADQAYGKLMSISDKLMYRYMEVLLGTSKEQISSLEARVAYGTTHPMALKKKMAFDIVSKFWSKDEAEEAQRQFEALFENKNYDKAAAVLLPKDTANPIWIVELLKLLGAIKTSSEARRLIEEGAVRIDDEKQTDFKVEVKWQPGMIIKVGKHRIYKLG